MPEVKAIRTTDFGLILTGVHDTNLAGGAGVSAASKLSPQDTTFRPVAKFSVTQPLGRNVAFLRGTAGYDFHQENKQLNSRRLDISAGALVSASACRASIFGDFTSQQAELVDSTQLSVLNQLTSASENVGLACGRATGVQGQLIVQNQDVTNSIDIQKLADHKSRSATLSIGYGRPSLGSIGIIAAYSEQEFPNRPDALGVIGDSFRNESYGVTYQKMFGRKLNVTASVADSIIHRKNAPPGIPLTASSLNYSVSTHYALSQRLSFDLAASRAIEPSDQPGKLFDISTVGDLSASYKVGSRFTFGLGGRILNTDSNADTTGNALAITNSRSNTVYGSIRYRQSDKISVTFDVRHETRETNVPIFDYSNTRISLSTALNF